jgi:glucosamine kinase
MPVVYSIDAGGSRTTVAVIRPSRPMDSWQTESFAIASVGEAVAVEVLEQLLRRIVEAAGPDQYAVGCIASSSMPVADEAPKPAALIDVVQAAAPVGRVVLVNDVVPLAFSPALDAGGVVVSCGTGSSVLARDPRSPTVIKVGGHEHIVSDQGSAYSLAREGLRAAARDADGLGGHTVLRADAEEFFGRPMPALGRWLAELPRVRAVVAGFAPFVTRAAESGDDVAREIATAEAASLVDAVDVAVRRLALGPRPTIAFAGSVLHGSSYFRLLVEDELGRRALTDDARENLRLLDGVAAGLQFAERLGEPAGPPVPDGVVLDINPT